MKTPVKDALMKGLVWRSAWRRLHSISPKRAMRYYQEKYPEVDDLVMVQVRQIAEMGAYVKLVSGRSMLV
jgi:hypothetical protein